MEIKGREAAGTSSNWESLQRLHFSATSQPAVEPQREGRAALPALQPYQGSVALHSLHAGVGHLLAQVLVPYK